ncbi:queuosine precursor transporter [bacterium]|nr:queuosine precursor transporter [bacterium]
MIPEKPVSARAFRYYDLIMAAFVTVLLVSNIVSTKITHLGPFSFDAGTLLFPLAYIFGDVLTEVYGYARSRRVIWVGFAANLLMSAIIMLAGALPPAEGWPYQESYMNVLGLTPRIVIASLVAYWAGEFSNSFVLAKMKLATKGRFLWTRTIGSTIVGEAVDTAIFAVVAFLGVLPSSLLVTVIISNYVFKVGVEVVFTPLTYLIVGGLKRAEGVDYYDRKTNFNPFLLSSKKISEPEA